MHVWVFTGQCKAAHGVFGCVLSRAVERCGALADWAMEAMCGCGVEVVECVGRTQDTSGEGSEQHRLRVV